MLADQDLRHVWHPCSQMKDYETFKPLEIRRASGCYLELHNGQRIIDAVSSWWCKSIGHGHPRLLAAIANQLEQFEHVMFANITHEPAVALAEKLSQWTRSLNKVFFASEGSSAIEIALKMSLHAQQLRGYSHKTHFIALENGYHGETLGALSVSDIGIYRAPYESLLFKTHFLRPVPYLLNTQDPCWKNCAATWQAVEARLAPLAHSTAAIIVEPLLQGAGGMQLYSADFLSRLRTWTQQHDILLIADECFTGIGRTGSRLACEQANIEPDILCLSKGLTGGSLPLSVILTTQFIYDLFYDDYSTGKAFLHSHTHSGNPLAISAALACLTILEDEELYARAAQLELIQQELWTSIAKKTGLLKNCRQLGAFSAADLCVEPHHTRAGYHVFQHAIALGALLRPVGNTLYWCPPLNIPITTLKELADITEAAILLFANELR